MEQFHHTITVDTQGQGLYEITREVSSWVKKQVSNQGLLTVFCAHTSASLTIQENADADVQRDIETFFKKLVPEDNSLYRHTMEGSDDMPAHIKSALTDVSLTIPVQQKKPVLGTWQGLYLFEHRTRPHTRTVHLHLIGSSPWRSTP